MKMKSRPLMGAGVDVCAVLLAFVGMLTYLFVSEEDVKKACCGRAPIGR
jgi:hypothetical protein